MRQWLETPQRLQSQVVNKAKEWLDGTGDKALADWDISRDPPYFGIRVPDIAEEKYLYVWLDAPIGYLASFKNYCGKRGLTSRRPWPSASRSISSARTSSTSIPCSGRRC